jgi:hypothetical protein
VKSNIVFVVSVFFLSCLVFFFERMFFQGGLLYEQIVFAMVLGVALFVLVFGILSRKYPSSFNFSKVFPYFLIGGLLFYSFGFSVIMTVDRSKSLYVLNWVNQKEPIALEGLGVALAKKYGSYDKVYVEQRVSEQVRRGVFTEDNGLIRVSRTGNFLWFAANEVAKVFKLNGWFRSRL